MQATGVWGWGDGPGAGGLGPAVPAGRLPAAHGQPTSSDGGWPGGRCSRPCDCLSRSAAKVSHSIAQFFPAQVSCRYFLQVSALYAKWAGWSRFGVGMVVKV